MTLFEPQKEPELHWDEYRLQVLCCLFRFFREDKVFEQIFSEFFKDHLLERGFSEGIIAYRVLYEQWAGMKQTNHDNHDVWRFVHMETEFKVDREWKHIIQTIKAVANGLGVALYEKHHEDDNTYRKRIAHDLNSPRTLISDEEAINQIYEELTSASVRGTSSRGVVAFHPLT